MSLVPLFLLGYHTFSEFFEVEYLLKSSAPEDLLKVIELIHSFGAGQKLAYNLVQDLVLDQEAFVADFGLAHWAVAVADFVLLVADQLLRVEAALAEAVQALSNEHWLCHYVRADLTLSFFNYCRHLVVL